MPHGTRCAILLPALLLALSPARAAYAATTVPPGFFDEVVAGADPSTGLAIPTAARFDPVRHGLWIIEKGPGEFAGPARVLARRRPKSRFVTAASLSCVDSTGERGLVDLEFDPGFASNHRVYLFYTRRYEASGACEEDGEPAGSRNLVVRFEEKDGRLVDPQIILKGPTLEEIDIHNGGSIGFLPDGTMLVSMGDNGIDPFVNQISRNMADLRGKILRINTDGTVPANNPFAGVTGVRQEIWASGLRNPFRFSVDPVTGDVMLTDVGQSSYEEVDEGRPGADYGWPCYEADAPYVSCVPQPAAGSLTFPILFYGHNGLTSPISGEAIVGGPVYRQTAFPPEYLGDYFFADFIEGWIRRARFGPGGAVASVDLFLSGADGPVDLSVGPDGCLYYVALASNEVHRVCPVGRYQRSAPGVSRR